MSSPLDRGEADDRRKGGRDDQPIGSMDDAVRCELIAGEDSRVVHQDIRGGGRTSDDHGRALQSVDPLAWKEKIEASFQYKGEERREEG